MIDTGFIIVFAGGSAVGLILGRMLFDDYESERKRFEAENEQLRRDANLAVSELEQMKSQRRQMDDIENELLRSEPLPELAGMLK